MNILVTYPHIANPERSSFLILGDYAVTYSSDCFHWHGCGLYLNYHSEGDGWDNPAQAQADALYCLHRADGLDHDEAIDAIAHLEHFGHALIAVVDATHR